MLSIHQFHSLNNVRRQSGGDWEKMTMRTRREMAIALLGAPLVVGAVGTNTLTEAESGLSAEQKPVPIPPPYSVDAANIISYTLYAEARGESFEGKKAVASVIQTRATRAKKPLTEICLQSKQFSCWNDLKAVPEFYITGEGIEAADVLARSKCFGITWMLMVNQTPWYHFTHFYNPDKATPDWAYELKGTRIIGRHVFGYIE